MKIIIDQQIKALVPEFNIIAHEMDVVVTKTEAVQELIKETEKELQVKYTIEDVIHIPTIKEGRDGYKKFGKDPSRYRLAVESLYRRIVKNYNLYSINDVVDIGNILSIRTMRSTAILDYNQIMGDVLVRLGTADDDYEGINRGKINVENIPVYVDDLGPFGSTTSDTIRTSITDETTKILVLIICFSNKNIESNINEMTELYTKYCNAKNIRRIEVKSEE
jgi:DNA/RNA-binding domain of Phe-tRNA-synthetase-like protein